MLFDLAKELDLLQWYDEEVWTKILETACHKKKINNIYDFKLIHQICYRLTTAQPESRAAHLNGKFDDHLKRLLEKHYTTNRQWKYNAETRQMRPIEEIIAGRESLKFEDTAQLKEDIDEQTIIQAREAEKKLKRMKMAKYSHDLFDEIIEEFMKEKKTILEMMAELDATEAEIYTS